MTTYYIYSNETNDQVDRKQRQTNTMKHTTKTKILAALKSGNARSLSALTKLTKSTKVATRISDLRAEGYDIRNTCKHLKSGEVRSTYQLITK